MSSGGFKRPAQLRTIRVEKRSPEYIDPDIVAILQAAGSIASVVELAIKIYEHYGHFDTRKSRRIVENNLARINDELGYLQHDVELIQEIASQAMVPGSRRFRLPQEAFLTREQYGRWKYVSTDLMTRLKRLVTFSNRVAENLEASALMLSPPDLPVTETCVIM